MAIASEKTAGADAFFLDANVVMYAGGGAHPLREPCRNALQRAVDRKIPLLTDSEVLQEILYRYFSLREADKAEKAYRATVRLCDEVLPVAEEDTARALELLLRHPRLTPRDAIHVATMERRGIQKLLSADRDFDDLDIVRRIDPADFPE